MNQFSEAVANHFLLIAAFNKNTHECIWYKSHGKMFDQPKKYTEGSYFFAEMSHSVHESDLPLLEKYVGNDGIYTVKDTIIILHFLRDGIYQPYYVEFINNAESEYVYCTVRETNESSVLLDEALLGFEKTMIKIIKVDLDSGKFKEIKVFEPEKPQMSDFYDWLNCVIDNYVFEADREGLREFLLPENIYVNLRTKDCPTFSYRRWFNNQWIIVLMRLIPCPNFYNNGHNHVMLYLSKIS